MGVNMAVEPYTYQSNQTWSVSYENWKDSAACSSADPRWFEVGTEGVDENEHHELIAKGLPICNGCPVRAACLNNATEEDLKWTTRGGRPPSKLWTSRGNSPGIGRTLLKVCGKGHENWAYRKSGTRFCLTCRREANRLLGLKYRRENREAYNAQRREQRHAARTKAGEE